MNDRNIWTGSPAESRRRRRAALEGRRSIGRMTPLQWVKSAAVAPLSHCRRGLGSHAATWLHSDCVGATLAPRLHGRNPGSIQKAPRPPIIFGGVCISEKKEQTPELSVHDGRVGVLVQVPRAAYLLKSSASATGSPP